MMWPVRAGLTLGAGLSLAVEDTAGALVREVAQPGLPMASPWPVGFSVARFLLPSGLGHSCAEWPWPKWTVGRWDLASGSTRHGCRADQLAPGHAARVLPKVSSEKGPSRKLMGLVLVGL